MGALVADPQDNMFSKKTFWHASALLLIGVQAQSHQMDVHAQATECCQEKTVGGVSYSLLPEVFHGSLPRQCLTSCVYTKTGMLSSPKFCFARGDLATECRDPPPPTEGPVAVHVIVKSATTGFAVADASVNFRTTTADMDYMDDTSYTNGEGVASFSVNDYDDEGENYDNDDVEGLGPSGAKVTLFGETNIKMEAEAGHSGSWWVIGPFSPSQGTSSFSMSNIYARGAPGRFKSLEEANKKERE